MFEVKNVFTMIFLAGLTVFFSGLSSFGSEKAGGYTQEQLDYTGQDETRTPSSLNLFYTYKNLPDDSDANTYTLRGIYRRGLGPDWDMLLRLNVPFSTTIFPAMTTRMVIGNSALVIFLPALCSLRSSMIFRQLYSASIYLFPQPMKTSLGRVSMP